MKSFLKFTLASILGVLIAFLLVLIILAGIISAASSKKEVTVKPHTILLARFDVPIVDRDTENPFENFSFGNFGIDGKLGLNHIIDNIDKASSDENIDGIFLDLSIFSAGVATVEEIRKSLVRFRESGKFVYAHADYYSQGSYYLASAADKVFMTPEGEIPWKGMSVTPIFFKRALDKLGIEPQVIRHGAYKSAAEPFILEKLSDENRQQLNDYITDVWDNLLEQISVSRGITVTDLKKLADDLTIVGAKSAYEHHFVDSLLYFDQVMDILKNLTETKEKDDIKSISLKKYTQVPKKRDSKGLIKNKIAVVYASGNIVTDKGTSNAMVSDKVSKVIREVRRDSSIKAIVFRVNSGGGSALASEVIWREVKLASQTKPLIASLGDVAGSGGYYIVTPARKIISNINTLTGSIGVIGLLPNGENFMKNKLGITSDVVKTNEHSDMGSFFRPLDSKEASVIEKEIENIYNTFANHVVEGRNITREAVDKIAGGRIYSGLDAKKIGLVDDIGGLKEAIEIAAKEAGLDTYRVVEYPKAEDSFEALIKQLTDEAQMRIIQSEIGENFRYYEEMKRIRNLKGVQAIMPFSLEIE